MCSCLLQGQSTPDTSMNKLHGVLDNTSSCCRSNCKNVRIALAHWPLVLVPFPLLPRALGLGSLELTPAHVLRPCHCVQL